MDLPSFLLGLLPVVAIGFVSVVAFRRRHDRRESSPLILNPYTLAVEPDANALGHLPVVQPAPSTTNSQKVDTPSVQPDANDPGTRPRIQPAPATSPEKV